MEIIIKLLDNNQEIPYELLLLADPSIDLVEEYVRRGYCYLAFRENELVGEFVLIHTHPQTIEIVNIAVTEGYQGQGIGRTLILTAIEEAKKLNASIIEIGTGNSGIKQLKLYQKCGFRIFGIDPDFFVRNYEEEIYEDGIQCKDMIRLRMEL
ncbi:putative N-acetyltransferase YvbK [compost metagenome]